MNDAQVIESEAMPPGYGFASGYDPAMSSVQIAEAMAAAEAAGFEYGIFSETVKVMRDGTSTLSAIAQATTTMRVGAVMVVSLRTPLLFAQTVATLDEIAGGRLFLAPGARSKTATLRHGLPEQNPATELEEYLDVARRLIDGQTVSHEGSAVRAAEARLGWTPLRPRVPFLLAATSRKGLELAGRIGDGVLLDSCSSPRYSRNAIGIMRAAAESAGRDPDELIVGQIVVCSIADSTAEALDAVRWEVASKLDPISHRFQRYRIAVGEPHMSPDDFPVFVDAWEKGGAEALTRAVPDSYVANATASGTETEVLARIDEYRAAGVQIPFLRAAGRGQIDRLLSLRGALPSAEAMTKPNPSSTTD